MALSLTWCTFAFSNDVHYQSTALLELQLTLVTDKRIQICEQMKEYSAQLSLNHHMVLVLLAHKAPSIVTILPELTRAAPKYAGAGDHSKPYHTSPMRYHILSTFSTQDHMTRRS